MKKNNKKIKSEDHLTVVLEDMNSKFDLMLENNDFVSNKIDNFNESLNNKIDNFNESLNKKVDNLSENFLNFKKDTQDNFKVIAKHLISLDDRLDNIEARLDKIEARLDKIEGAVDEIKNDILKIRKDLKEKISYDEFEKLEKRVIKLERLTMAG